MYQALSGCCTFVLEAYIRVIIVLVLYIHAAVPVWRALGPDFERALKPDFKGKTRDIKSGFFREARGREKPAT